MDLTAPSMNCQLLKAFIFETYRMANEPTSIRYVARPVTLEDGEFKHELTPGTWLSAPHWLINRDPSVFAEPDKFHPERFLETDSESGKSVARYGRLRPWGAGASMCKGRTFAEKEIMSLGAAIISLWDMGPASGSWKIPGMIPGTGVKRPVKDIRVLITRRTLTRNAPKY
jgi:cytochrome P450